MPNPRMVPADDARVTLEAASLTGGYGFSFLDTYVRDLAHTVVEQAAQIVDLYEEVNDHHHDLLQVMEERNQQAEQIKRLQKAVTEAEVIFWETTGYDLEQQLERKGAKLNRDDLEVTDG